MTTVTQKRPVQSHCWHPSRAKPPFVAESDDSYTKTLKVCNCRSFDFPSGAPLEVDGFGTPPLAQSDGGPAVGPQASAKARRNETVCFDGHTLVATNVCPSKHNVFESRLAWVCESVQLSFILIFPERCRWKCLSWLKCVLKSV